MQCDLPSALLSGDVSCSHLETVSAIVVLTQFLHVKDLFSLRCCSRKLVDARSSSRMEWELSSVNTLQSKCCREVSVLWCLVIISINLSNRECCQLISLAWYLTFSSTYFTWCYQAVSELSNLVTVSTDQLQLECFQKVSKLWRSAAVSTTITAGVLPSSLDSLAFGYSFNQLLTAGVLPDGLKTLIFGSNFNQSIVAGVLPSGLLNLKSAVISDNLYSISSVAK